MSSTQESDQELKMGDAIKQAIMVIKSSKLVVRGCNILEGIMASMSWVQIVCTNNSHDIAQAWKEDMGKIASIA